MEQACADVVKINEAPINPNVHNRELYAHFYSIYRKLYENNKSLAPQMEFQKLENSGGITHDEQTTSSEEDQS